MSNELKGYPTRLLFKMREHLSNEALDEVNRELDRRFAEQAALDAQEAAVLAQNQALRSIQPIPVVQEGVRSSRPSYFFDWDVFSKDNPHRVHKCTKECVK